MRIEKRRLPEGWRWNKLEDVCEIIAGQSPPSSTYKSHPEGIPFFQGKADFGHIHPVARVWCIEPTKIALPGDILISVRAPVGPTNIADVECCIGRGLAAIRCKEGVNRDFILYTLKSSESKLIEKGTGSTFEAISRNDIVNLEIPLPPLSEQERIAAILNEQMAAVDAARKAAEARLEAIRALPAACLRQVFPSPDQQLPEGWKQGKLEDFYDITSSKRVFQSEWKTSGVPFYRAREIVKLSQDGFVDNELFISEEMYAQYSEKYGIPKPEDILITGVGTLGVCYVVKQNDRFYFKDGNIIWLKKKHDILSSFVEYAFKTEYLKEQINDNSGTTVGTYTIIRAKNTLIPFPSIPEQQQITSFLDKQMTAIERARKAAEEELAAINALPAALLRRAFAGEL